ncbi:anhydro-N-acetylmuramic acid kinase AnmK [Lapidilactobacillus luobeiensis]|uniref:anhydro-N-acetylmuramic acid kinase AnmK n=1 Tax=Lapidilactobacillus luobeiensis TaxID=2950371 RepID=UPI0035A24971
MLAVGLMSGTSLDGTDAALVEITGVNEQTKVQLRHFNSYPFTAAVKERIQAALTPETSDVAAICSLDFELGALFGAAVQQVCREAGVPLSALSFIASHGQTIYHLPRPENNAQVPSTMQIGEPAVIAEQTRIPVISNFREADLAAGGQGAPIVPYSEYVLYRSATATRILQNIGGIGNATIIPRQGHLNDLLAFDTGPGNMVIDELCRHFYQEEYDHDGRHGAAGQVDETVLRQLLTHPYFQRPLPKTTGREDFGQAYAARLLKKYADLAPDDLIATATALTARSIAGAIEPYCQKPTELIVAGGGSYNRTLMAMLQEALPQVAVSTQEDHGYSSAAKEAIAMVVLGNQTWQGQPSNVPSATGANRSVILGRITPVDAS